MTSIDAAEPADAVAVTVSFAGHRRIEPGRLAPALERVFTVIAEAVAEMAQSPTGNNSETIGEAHAHVLKGSGATPGRTLLIGFAAGADRVAVEVWRRLGLGKVHALFPYADPDQPEAFGWTDVPHRDPDTRVDLAPAPGRDLQFHTWTSLDGSAADAAFPIRNAHMEQSRWLVRWSEIVIVAWDGAPPKGPGGTADTVAVSIAAGQPVVWIDTSTPDLQVRLISPDRFWRNSTHDEIRLSLKDDRAQREGILLPLDARTLATMLVPRFAPPPAESERRSRMEFLAGEPSYGWLTVRANKLLALCWKRLNNWLAPGAGGVEAPLHTKTIIDTSLREYDERATKLGAIHRSAQVALLLTSVLAVTLGTLPAFAPELKLTAVCFELAVIWAAQRYYAMLSSTRTQFKWGDARRLAERLRALQATWPLGIDFGDERSEAAGTWTDWHARVIRRTVGAPLGDLSTVRLKQAAKRARDYGYGIVDGQRAYHVVTHERMETLHHGLTLIERRAFWVLSGFLVTFILWYFVHLGAEALHLEELAHVLDKPPAWLGGLLLMASAIAPAIAAACMGVEAKLAVLDTRDKSKALAERYQAYVRRITDDSLVLRDEEVLRDAASTLVADVDRWRDSAAQRGMTIT